MTFSAADIGAALIVFAWKLAGTSKFIGMLLAMEVVTSTVLEIPVVAVNASADTPPKIVCNNAKIAQEVAAIASQNSLPGSSRRFGRFCRSPLANLTTPKTHSILLTRFDYSKTFNQSRSSGFDVEKQITESKLALIYGKGDHHGTSI
jgi:hypothetical protein